MRGNGRSRQRQNFGAVGQVTRAMVVALPSVWMVIFLRSFSDSGWLQVAQSLSPASRLQCFAATADCAAASFCGDALGELFHVGATQRGDGNFLAGAVNRHRLQRRLLGQRVGQRTREAFFQFAARPGFVGICGGHESYFITLFKNNMPKNSH